MDIIQIFFVAMLAFSIVSNFLSIPGNFVVFLNTLLYGIATNFENMTFSFLLLIFILAVAIELLEYLIIAFGARKHGASKLGVVVAIIGGIGGSISGFFFSPVLGAIVGGLIGFITGTMTIELLRGKHIREALQATMGALLGRVGGLSVKVIGTITLVVIVMNRLIF
jgi:uncharacterized protein YqgC (DUF456 family)